MGKGYLRFAERALLLGCCLFGIAVIALGAWFSFPNAETLLLTGTFRRASAVFAIQELLLNYDGRYFTNILHGLNPLAWGWLAGYRYMAIAGFFLFAGCFAFLLETFIPRGAKITWRDAFLAASVHFAISPDLSSELFNMIGSFVYLYSICCWMIWVSAAKRFLETKAGAKQALWFFIAAFFLVASAGCNEQTLLLNLLTFLYALLSVFFYKGALPRNQQLIALWPLAIIGAAATLFFVSCPGVRMRAFYIESPLHPVSVSSMALRAGNHYLLNTGALLSCGGGLWIAYLLLFCSHTSAEPKASSTPPVTAALFLFIASAAIIFPFYLPMGGSDIIPFRIFSQVFTLLQLGLIGLAIQSPLRRGIGWKGISKFRLLFILWIVAGFLLFDNNYKTVIREFTAGNYHREQALFQRQAAAMQELAASDKLWKSFCFDTFPGSENMIHHVVPLAPNRESDGVNRGYEIYFGLHEVSFCSDTFTKQTMLNNLIDE